MLFEKILQQLTGNLPMLDMVFINPPHFHLIADRFDVSISLPNYEILEINVNKNKQNKFQGSTWETSGQMKLNNAFLKWIEQEERYNTNEQRIFEAWNMLNRDLERAYFNFEQTRKYITKLIVKTKSKLDRDDLQEIASQHSFINKETLQQVFDSIGVN